MPREYILAIEFHGFRMKLFRLLGASERQGFGGPLIFKTAMQNDFRHPEIITNIERTELHVWNIDLADSYPKLTDDEKAVLRVISKTGYAISVNSIKETLKLTEYRVRKAIPTLEGLKLVRKVGNGPATKYTTNIGSIEFLTGLQIAMEELKKSLN